MFVSIVTTIIISAAVFTPLVNSSRPTPTPVEATKKVEITEVKNPGMQDVIIVPSKPGAEKLCQNREGKTIQLGSGKGDTIFADSGDTIGTSGNATIKCQVDPTPPKTPNDIPQRPQTPPPAPNRPAPFEGIKSKISPNAQVHAVGVHDPNVNLPKNAPTGQVDIEVAASKNPVVLVLTSYNPAKWNIKPSNGVKIEYVITSSYEGGIEVLGLPKDTPVYNLNGSGSFHFYKDDSEPYYRTEYSEQQKDWVCTDKIDTYGSQSDYMEMLQMVEKMTGKQVHSVQGSYGDLKFKINDDIKGSYLATQREGGRCYKNADGSISRS